MDAPARLLQDGREKGTFDTGIQMALRRMLASPTFVFRVEEDGAPKRRHDRTGISDLELASRLSFFLWSSIPDDPLLDWRPGTAQPAGGARARSAPDAGRPARRGAGENFAGQWLHVRNLKTIVPNHDEFPDFDNKLRQAFQREAELFFASIMREDRSVIDLLTADYTFVNERLAKHYGIPYVYGSQFRRVTLTDDARRGLLGKGARSDGDFARGPDGSGFARQVDSREPARHASASAARQRAAARRPSSRTGAARSARADGDASRGHPAAPAATS